MKNKVQSIQIADAIAIRGCKASFNMKLLFSDSDELFYEFSLERYVYIFKYGVVCFYNFNDDEKRKVISELEPYCKNSYEVQKSEEVEVLIGSSADKITLEVVELSNITIESLRLIMLNASQSVVLDQYTEIIEAILEDTNKHTSYLEENGKLDIGGNKLKRYIGKILNIKNKISVHLYIFDSHDITWGDETLNKLDQALKKTFDLKDRSKSVQDQIGIIKENLELFKDIMYHRQSSSLEWIIIILILVEVIDMFILKFL